jgi:hypothetical protein
MAKNSSKAKKAQQGTRPAHKVTSKKTAASSKKKTSPKAPQPAQKAGQQKRSQPSPKKKPSARKTSRNATGGSPGATSTQARYSFPPPVFPRPEQLPLSDPNWTWEGFQAFCLDLVSRLPITKEAGKNHHFGKQGDAQGGIDLFADMKNGEQWGFQCKKEKRFTEADTQKAIKVTTYNADKFIILLSIEATAAVRKVMQRRKKWDVWDVRDISQAVRQLPPDEARQLLDPHFRPAWRKSFLGVSAVSTFPTAEAFFRPLLDGSKLFNHTWALIGRAGYIEGLHSFVGSDHQRVAVFLGRGGIGKTKLLHAFSQGFESRHATYKLCFLAEGLPVTQDSLDDLSPTPCVVVVDDAHRRSDDVAAPNFPCKRKRPSKGPPPCPASSTNCPAQRLTARPNRSTASASSWRKTWWMRWRVGADIPEARPRGPSIAWCGEVCCGRQAKLRARLGVDRGRAAASSYGTAARSPSVISGSAYQKVFAFPLQGGYVPCVVSPRATPQKGWNCWGSVHCSSCACS